MKRIIFMCVWIVVSTMSANQKEYVVGVEDLQYLPFYSYHGNKFSGYSADVLDLFAKKQGVKFTYRALPVKRLYKELLSGTIDFKYPDNPNWNQTQKSGIKIFYSQGVATYIDGVIVRKENIDKKELVTLGTIRGFTPWDYLAEVQAKQVTLQENENMEQLFGMLEKKRIDGAYLNIDVANYFLNQRGKQGFEFNKNLKYTQDAYHLSSTKHESLLKDFNLFLEKNKSDIDVIKRKYKIAQ